MDCGIIYLTLTQAQTIHEKTIKYSGGGTYEILDTGKLDSVLQHIQNDDYVQTAIRHGVPRFFLKLLKTDF